jgi:hypothetical protein
MKIIKRTIFVMFLALMLMSFTNIYLRMTSEEPLVIPKNDVVLVPIEIEKIPIEIDQTDKFLDAIGMRESSNRYDVVNGWGYMGKYQFGRKTLKALGYDVSKKEFLNSPYLQEKAMLDLLHHNRKILKTYIEYWDGKTIHGERITESGILAAAHLAGPGNVKKFFRKGAEFKDGNGTKMTSYLTQFSGYELNLD